MLKAVAQRASHCWQCRCQHGALSSAALQHVAQVCIRSRPEPPRSAISECCAGSLRVAVPSCRAVTAGHFAESLAAGPKGSQWSNDGMLLLFTSDARPCCWHQASLPYLNNCDLEQLLRECRDTNRVKVAERQHRCIPAASQLQAAWATACRASLLPAAHGQMDAIWNVSVECGLAEMLGGATAGHACEAALDIAVARRNELLRTARLPLPWDAATAREVVEFLLMDLRLTDPAVLDAVLKQCREAEVRPACRLWPELCPCHHRPQKPLSTRPGSLSVGFRSADSSCEIADQCATMHSRHCQGPL